MIRFLAFIAILLSQAAFAAQADIIPEIKPLSVRGVNYFPLDTPWSKMCTETPTEVCVHSRENRPECLPDGLIAEKAPGRYQSSQDGLG